MLFSAALGVLVLGGSGAAFAEPEGERKSSESLIARALPAAGPESRVLGEFYRARGFRLAWGEAGSERRAALLADLKTIARAEGLDPRAYDPAEGGSDIESDLRLSAALLRLGRDLSLGRVAPDRALGGTGIAPSRSFDGLRFLRGLAERRDLAAQAAQVRPPFVAVARLREAIAALNETINAGGWPRLPDGPKMVPGESDERVVLLRQRLAVSGDLKADAAAEGTLYDPALAEAVRRFQTRHGLEPDAAVGGRTLAALNVSAEDRLRQLALNLERWRWVSPSLGHRYVVVNIAAATLDLVEDGAVQQSMRVVIGDPGHPTPGMVSNMASLVLNPPWSVPASIAAREILPKLQRNPNYLATSNLKIVDYPADSPESAGDGIDWNAMGGRFPYRLRQDPGPDNALGRLKFNLRGSDDIYLHDTPNRRAFTRANRALSHGCIRLERPVDLAEALLGDRWRGRIDSALESDPKTRTLRLERTVPVYLLYWTAWVEADGTLQFRDDVYGHDRRLRAALTRPRAAPTSPTGS